MDYNDEIKKQIHYFNNSENCPLSSLHLPLPLLLYVSSCSLCPLPTSHLSLPVLSSARLLSHLPYSCASSHPLFLPVSLPHLVFALQDMFLMAAMGPPGGGRTVISSRLQSRFNIINMTFPTVRANGAGGGRTVEGKSNYVPENEGADQGMGPRDP